MGFSSRSILVVGVSMEDLFTDFKDKSDIFDEYDKYGNKTGKQFKEEKLIGVLSNGKEVIIAEKRNSNGGWEYNWYESIGFDETYNGDLPNIDISIHQALYENIDLKQLIMGIEVCETDGTNGGDNFIVKVDEDITNTAIERCRKNLAELFGYMGNINLYVIHSMSY